MSSQPDRTWWTLAMNIARPLAHWRVCEDAARLEAEEHAHRIKREWRVMVRDPLFAYHGGVDTSERRAAYVARRVAGLRRTLVAYMHRPEHRALDLALAELEAASLAAAEPRQPGAPVL